MGVSYREIGELIARVRARWRRVILYRAAVVAALAAAAVVLLGLLTAYAAGRSTHALAAVGVVTVIVAFAVAVRALSPARRVPSDAQIARFIEEREPTLDDRLVSAVDVARGGVDAPPPALASAMLADAGRRAAHVEPATIVSPDLLRRGGFQAAAACFALLAVIVGGRQTARRSFDALSLSVFPARVHLDVQPGNARLQAGTALTVQARLAGNTAPVAAQLLRASSDAEATDAEAWSAIDMPVDADGAFRFTFDALGESFKYRVVAGALRSDVFDVAVVRPPRVTRVDVEYRYPKALGLPPRTEEDSGDIYAPAGTDVTLHIHTDREAASGQMTLGGGQSLPLTNSDPTTLEAALTISGDDSYRLRVANGEGMATPGETEYFIRMLDDRPPDVRVMRPARDKSVTALEEIDIEAEAQDDFGVAALELVYTVRGGSEKVVPFDIPARATTVSGFHTLYLEDLKVKAGDFISYYVRARDLPRGRRASEARSDMFFLEVKPFEQEFTLAQSQGGGGGSGSPQIDDLVNAQKEIIVATWKLDRRALTSGASSEADIRAVGKAEAELKVRVEDVASQFRESTMRDPRRRGPTPGAPRAGQTLPEEDAMTAASKAMTQAITALEGLKTKTAMPPELEALNHLLKAQATVKERQVTQQTGAGGQGQNRQAQDLSSLFDKELARQQQTNYETKNSAEQEEKSQDESMLDKIRELAKRQDELLRRQEELARQRQQMTPEQLKRALETLTREQQQLREQAERMARQMGTGTPNDPGQQNPNSQKNQNGQQPPQPGQQAQSGQQQGQQNQGGQSQGGQNQSQGQQQANRQGQSGEMRPGQQGGRAGERGNAMREVSEEMRNAASELSRQDPSQASARGNRALDKLRDLERQMQAGQPNEQRRAIGDMQLEARQLADAQRQLSTELGRVGQGENGKDALRRLAGEQDRLAERAERLQQSMDRQASTPPPSPNGQASGRNGATGEQSANAQKAVGDAAKEMQRQRVAERMQQSAEQLRQASGDAGQPANGDKPSGDKNSGKPQPSSSATDTRTPQQSARAAAGAQEEIARSLDRLADRLASANGPSDDQSRKMNDQLARAQELRERMERISRELNRLGQQSGPEGTQAGGQNQGRSPDGKPSPGERESASKQPAQPGGQAGQGQPDQNGSGGDSGEVARLRDEYQKQLQATKDLLNEMQKDEAKKDERTAGDGSRGFTYEGQGMVLSAPGTQAFKQDFAKWEELRKQATLALEQAETRLSRQLQDKASKDRLATGIDDRPPASYQQQVDSYFKALAGKKGR